MAKRNTASSCEQTHHTHVQFDANLCIVADVRSGSSAMYLHGFQRPLLCLNRNVSCGGCEHEMHEDMYIDDMKLENSVSSILVQCDRKLGTR